MEGEDFDVDTITQILLGEYEINEETAAADAADFVESLLEADLIVES
ncbi:MAG: PqqD family peptide modification chaperone [Paludibacteraceae bacterium]|nr:PqqD family peptide modification chaperone [Paludibacteraceae bacterium]